MTFAGCSSAKYNVSLKLRLLEISDGANFEDFYFQIKETHTHIPYYLDLPVWVPSMVPLQGVN